MTAKLMTAKLMTAKLMTAKLMTAKLMTAKLMTSNHIIKQIKREKTGTHYPGDGTRERV